MSYRVQTTTSNKFPTNFSARTVCGNFDAIIRNSSYWYVLVKRYRYCSQSVIYIIYTNMAPSHSIVHSSKVAIERSLHDSDGQSTETGILSVVVSSKILHIINDDSDVTNTFTYEKEKTDDIRMTDLIQTDDTSVFKIQICTIQTTTNTSNSVVTYETQYTSLEQIVSSLTLPRDENITSYKDSDISVTKTAAIEYQKLKYLISLLKETTTNQSNLDTESVVSNSSKRFIVLQLMPQSEALNADHLKSTLKISIKERLPSTMVRIVWSATLSCVEDANHNAATTNKNMTKNSATELLDLSLRLTEQQQEVELRLRTVQEHYQLLLRDRDGWKDTAQKLDGQWEKEKSLLFQNFCTLYTNKHDHDQTIITQLEQEIQALKKQVVAQETSSVPTRPTINENKTKLLVADLPECLQDVPDDHRVTFDNDVVRRLARGERVPIPSNNSSIPRSHVSDSEIPTPIPTSTSAQRKRRHNPISGATEYMDPDDALHDILVPTTVVSSQPKKTRVAGPKHVDDKTKTSKTLRSKPVVASIKKEVPSPPHPLTVATKNGNDSDTGSEEDYMDKSMEAQIMADLEALRKI